jgi:parvulin-like peptidyl-prolyl isomerase
MGGVLALSMPLAAVSQDAVVGKLGTTEIKISDLKKILEGQNPEVRTQLAGSLPDLERLVRTELVRQALLNEARTKGFEKRPEVIAQMDRAREQALIEAYANSVSRPPPEYPSEDEVKAFYESNKSAFATPAQYKVAQIFLSLPESSDKTKVETTEKAQDLVAQLQKGGDFAALARELSGHAESAAKGGDMGWVAENQLIPEIRTVLNQLAPGKVGGPAKSAQGLHIVKLVEKKDAATRPIAEARQSIVATLRYRKARENERKYFDELDGKTPTAVNQIELTKLQSTLR